MGVAVGMEMDEVVPSRAFSFSFYGTPSEFRLSIDTIGFAVKLFPVGCAQDSRRVP